MAGFFHTRARRIIGGAPGAITGFGGLSQNGGSISSGLPWWMRGGVAGGFAGWLTSTTNSHANLGRLFHMADASDFNRVDCYIEPGSNRWVAAIKTNNVSRAVIYPTGAAPALGVTLGFAATWTASRFAMAIGATSMVAASYEIPITAMSTFILGNRVGNDRPLAATFPMLEWYSEPIPEAALSGLAQRPLPNTAPTTVEEQSISLNPQNPGSRSAGVLNTQVITTGMTSISWVLINANFSWAGGLNTVGTTGNQTITPNYTTTGQFLQIWDANDNSFTHYGGAVTIV